MAYSTALEEEEEAGWQCCMPPRGSFGVLSPSQGAAEGVRNRDNPPPQPRARPVEAHLGTAMRIAYTLWAGAGAPEGVHAGGRWGPMARRRRRFFGLFFFFRGFLLVFMGIRRTCGHAITPCDSLSAQLTVP